MIDIDKRKFCVAPFNSLVIDKDATLLPCCEFIPANDNNDYLKYTISDSDNWRSVGLNSLKKLMIQNLNNPIHQPIDGCKHCNYNEDLLGESLRKHLNSNSHYDIDTLIDAYNNNIVLDIEHVEIRVSNYCNISCIMCGSYASSNIADEYRKFEKEYNSIGLVMPHEKTVKWWDDDSLIEKLKNMFKNIRSINFAGGEPLIVPELIELLNYTDPEKLENVSLNTNLTKLPKRILDIFAKLDKEVLMIMISLEGIGEHNDYIRHGSDWETIENNIKLLSKLDINHIVSHVLQHTSIYALPGLIEFADKNNISLNFKEVYHGSYPSPGVLTINSVHPEDMKNFNLWLSDYKGEYKDILYNWVCTYKFDNDLYNKFHQYIKMLDSIRNKSFYNTFNISKKREN